MGETRIIVGGDIHGIEKQRKAFTQYCIQENPEIVADLGDGFAHFPNKIDDKDIDPQLRIQNTIQLQKDHFPIRLENMKKIQKETNAAIYITPGNRDTQIIRSLIEKNKKGIYTTLDNTVATFQNGDTKFTIYGFGNCPIGPGPLKDFEGKDIGQENDIRNGIITTKKSTKPIKKIQTATLKDLQNLLHRGYKNPESNPTIGLFHNPPYDTNLDIAGIGTQIHVGSKAIRNFVERNSELLVAVCGHVHETVENMGGIYEQTIGNTQCAAIGNKATAHIMYALDIHIDEENNVQIQRVEIPY